MSKITAWFKALPQRIWTALKALFTKKATPTQAPVTASPVAPPDKPQGPVFGPVPPVVTDPQKTSLDNFLKSGAGYGRKDEAPVVSSGPDPHADFDFGVIPNSIPKSHLMTGGEVYPFTLEVKQPQPLRLSIASERSMGKGDFDNYTVRLYQGGVTIKSVSSPASIGTNFVPFGTLEVGKYQLDVSVDKTDNIVLLFYPA